MKYIDHQEVLNITNQGLDVFEYYFSGIELTNPKKYFKLRASEKTASARVAFHNGQYKLTDFGNQSDYSRCNAIEFVRKQEGLTFHEALQFILCQIKHQTIDGEGFKKKSYRAEYDYREVTKDDKKGDYNFCYKAEPTAKDLEAIGRYVTAETLQRYHCKCVEKYEMCSYSEKKKRDIVHIFKATEDYPIFVFDYGSFQKIYKPHEQDKKYRFSYAGKKPLDYVYGLEILENATNEFVDTENSNKHTPPAGKPDAKVVDLFRCSGESDALNLASLGYHVYWLNSESANYGDGKFNQLDKLCKNHYQIMDLDSTGRAQAIKQGLEHITLKTIFLPEELKKKRDFRGNPCKDLKDLINTQGKTQQQTEFIFGQLKAVAKPMMFWEKGKDSKGKVTVTFNLQYYYWFLEANGFYAFEQGFHKNEISSYVQIVGNIVTIINPLFLKRIVKQFTTQWIKSKRLLDEVLILNKLATTTTVNESTLQELPRIELNFVNCQKDEEYINFKNGSLKITPTEITRVGHGELPNYILGKLELGRKKEVSHLIQKNIYLQQSPVEIETTEQYQTLLDRLQYVNTVEERKEIQGAIAAIPDTDRYTVVWNDKDYIFTRFLKDLASIHWQKEEERPLTLAEEKEENLALCNLMFVLGYHCAQYKNPSKPWVSYIQDYKISAVGTSSGRSGKSLISMAIRHVRPSFYISGRQLGDKNQYQFVYEGMTEFHDYLEVDDFHEFGDFSFFYAHTTGKRPVNQKNIANFDLEFAESGKMGFSSNFELPNTNASTLARILNCVVSDYYHEHKKGDGYQETRTPAMKYGKMMYDDFTDEEWQKFYNLIAYCIQLQMRFHKIQPPMENIAKRQLRKELSSGLGRNEEFIVWAESYLMHKKPGDLDETEGVGYFDTLISKEKAYKDFKNTLSTKQASSYKITSFKKHFIAFCEYKGYLYNPEEFCTDKSNQDPLKWRILKRESLTNKQLEFFYVVDPNFQSEFTEVAKPQNNEVYNQNPNSVAPF